MKPKVLYKDKYGNKAILDIDDKIAILNARNKLVTSKEAKIFLKMHGVQFIENKNKLYTEGKGWN